jgi:phenylpropionate dioxygenase-like ring-hydroxylating dioxygenase large terminal subunit
MIRAFNNPKVATQSWYVIALSDEIKPGQVLSRYLLDRRVAVYRGEDGTCHALNARCPHLGANLARGLVMRNSLRCPFHYWTFTGNGRCAAVPTMSSVPRFARTFSYPLREKYGAVWIFNGPEPLFSLPFFAHWKEDELSSTCLKPQTLSCHPHVITSNGLDLQHFKTVHELDFVEEPVLDEPDRFRARLTMRIRLRAHNLFERALRPLAGEILTVCFTTWGGNLATIEGRLGPLPLLVLFTHRPLEQGRSASQTFLFAPRQQGIKQLLQLDRCLLFVGKLVMAYILIKDRELLDDLDFRDNLVESDAPLAAFIRQVNRMEVFDSGNAEWRPLSRRGEAL